MKTNLRSTHHWRHPRAWSARLAAMTLAVALSAAVPDAPSPWRPLPAVELATPPSEEATEAGAEVLLSLRELEVFRTQSREKNYRRVKIHEERALEALGKLELAAGPGQSIEALAARVTHRDGTSVEVPRVRIEDNAVARSQGWKWDTKRLIVPGLQAGDVVDVQWEVVDARPFSGWRYFFCQEELPVRRFEFQVGSFDMGMNLSWFRAPGARLEHNGVRRDTLTITNLPAFQQEPDATAVLDRRATVLLTYGQLPKDLDKLWADYAAGLANELNYSASPNAAVKRRAQELTAGARDDEDRLGKLYRFCREEVTNASYDESPESVAYRTKGDEHGPGVVLAGRRGTWTEIDRLFAALCRAAGFEVHLTASADRDEIADIHFAGGNYLLRNRLVAVKTGTQWRFCSPGYRPLPFGMVRWENEGTDALLSDPHKATFTEIPRAGPEKTYRWRKGRFVLDETGQLEGDVEETLTGHLAILWRGHHWSETPAKRERAVRDQIEGDLPSAEVQNIRIEALGAAESPLVLRYHLRVPAFAEEAGNRLIFQPGIFYQRAGARFTATKRVSDISFDYAWQEKDEFELQLPAGFELDAAQSPAPVQAGEGVIRHEVGMTYDPHTRLLGYAADFSLGKGGAVLFSAKSYPGIKTVFERIQANRTHVLVLKPSPPVAAIPGGRP